MIKRHILCIKLTEFLYGMRNKKVNKNPGTLINGERGIEI